MLLSLLDGSHWSLVRPADPGPPPFLSIRVNLLTISSNFDTMSGTCGLLVALLVLKSTNKDFWGLGACDGDMKFLFVIVFLVFIRRGDLRIGALFKRGIFGVSILVQVSTE